MITLYRPANSSVDYQRAMELADYCGLKAAELIAFSVERLLIHELLVRVTSDLSVPDGPNYEDLGINLRSMVSTIYQRHILPELGNLQSQYDLRLDDARGFVKQQLDEQLFTRDKEVSKTKKHSFLARLFGSNPKSRKSSSPSDPKEFTALAHWQSELRHP